MLGRLVPSGTGMMMFDRHPLGVGKDVAIAVAQSAGDWLRPVRAALKSRRLTQDDLLREDYELTCDVPELELLRYATRRSDLERVMMQLRSGRDEIGPAAYRVLTRARAGQVPAADAPYVGAALLNVHAFDTMRRDILRSAAPATWDGWIPLLAEPARTRARLLARLEQSAA